MKLAKKPVIKFIIGLAIPVSCIVFLITNSIPTLKDYEKSNKENGGLPKVVFFMFLPLFVMTIYATVVCIQINLTVSKVRKENKDLDEFSSYRLAAREGNKDDLMKYLSTKVKTPLDVKINTETFKSDDVMFHIDYKNSKGITVLQTVILAKQLKLVSKSHVECVEILLSHGANVQDAFPLKSSENSEQKEHLYGLALFVTIVFLKKPIHRWYALTIMKILLAAGYKMETLEEYLLLKFLMKNYYEDNSMETRFFVESLDFSVFQPHVLRQVIDQFNIENDDTATEDTELHVTHFLESVRTRAHSIQSLQKLTRQCIRAYILDIHSKNNLYFLIVQLPLPCNVIEYLLYGQRPPGIGHFMGYSGESVV